MREDLHFERSNGSDRVAKPLAKPNVRGKNHVHEVTPTSNDVMTFNARPPRVYVSHVSKPPLFRARVASPANVSYVKFTGCIAQPSDREFANLSKNPCDFQKNVSRSVTQRINASDKFVPHVKY